MFFPCTRRLRRDQRGTTAVEVALTLPFFLGFLFAIMELARAMYLWSTVTQVSRHYAHRLAVVDFNDGAALAAAQRSALFNRSDLRVPIGGALNASNFQVRYLRADGVSPVSTMPECPPQNIINCTRDPEGPDCIRFVQVRLCQPGGGDACTRVPYPLLLPPLLVNLAAGSFSLPTFSTLAPAGSLGFVPGTSDSCP